MAADRWTDLGDGLLVRQSAAFEMNSTVLLGEGHAVLVDPGILPSELDDIAARVRDAGAQEVTLVLTHGHWDHVLGPPWWPGASTLAHDRFASEVTRDRAYVREQIEALATRHGESWTRGFTPYRPDRAVSGLHFTRLGPWRVVFRDAPGHSESQLSIHLPDRSTLIAADMLSDIEIPLLAGPCAPYLRTLEQLRPLAQGGAIETLIPGHGAIADGAEARNRLTRDLDYLTRLERALARAVAAGLSKEAAQEKLQVFEYGGAPIAGESLTQHRENVGEAYPARSAP